MGMRQAGMASCRHFFIKLAQALDAGLTHTCRHETFLMDRHSCSNKCFLGSATPCMLADADAL